MQSCFLELFNPSAAKPCLPAVIVIPANGEVTIGRRARRDSTKSNKLIRKSNKLIRTIPYAVVHINHALSTTRARASLTPVATLAAPTFGSTEKASYRSSVASILTQ